MSPPQTFLFGVGFPCAQVVTLSGSANLLLGFLASLFSLILLGGCGSSGGSEPQPLPNGAIPVRVGYFPNVTHAQAVLGLSPERADYQKALGDEYQISSRIFNAGPSVIEALFGGELDIGFLGPSPIINGWLASRGTEFHVISGACSNGIVIVTNPRRSINSLEQLRGLRIATPQMGNTQDISARHFVVHQLGGTLREQGGDTTILPISNPEIEIAFEKDQIDVAWIPEPWASRLIESGRAKFLAEESSLWPDGRFALTAIIARKGFLEHQPEAVVRFLQAHIGLTEELQNNPLQFVEPLNKELKRLISRELPARVLEESLRRIDFSVEPDSNTMKTFYQKALDLNMTRRFRGLTLDNLVQDQWLRQAQQRRNPGSAEIKNPNPDPISDEAQTSSVSPKGSLTSPSQTNEP
jgi:NitT/TauT family transport system substrate-binding protein